MIILHGPSLIHGITDPVIRALVSQRFSQILSGEPYDYDQHGYMVIVEPGDSIESLESETCCSILHNAFDGTHFGDPDFTPCFEALEEHTNCYEMVFILSDSGFGIAILIPKHLGINSDLLAICTEYAVAAMTVHS